MVQKYEPMLCKIEAYTMISYCEIPICVRNDDLTFLTKNSSQSDVNWYEARMMEKGGK